MRDGVIQQVGTPKKIYDEPKNAYTADFIGDSNIISGKMIQDKLVEFFGTRFECLDKGFAPNQPVDVVIRPEDIKINRPEAPLRGRVINSAFKGTFYDLTVLVGDYELSVKNTKDFPEGSELGLTIPPDGIHIMAKEALTNEYRTVITGDHTVDIAGVDFEFTGDGTTYQKGDRVIATIDFNAIELTDDEKQGRISGNITDMIYKGKYYQAKVWLDNDTALLVDTPYEWDADDRVGLLIQKSDIKVRRDEEN